MNKMIILAKSRVLLVHDVKLHEIFKTRTSEIQQFRTNKKI